MNEPRWWVYVLAVGIVLAFMFWQVFVAHPYRGGDSRYYDGRPDYEYQTGGR